MEFVKNNQDHHKKPSRAPFYALGILAPIIIASSFSVYFYLEKQKNLNQREAEFFFQQGSSPENIKEPDFKTVLFLGDIMFDRGVERLMKKNTFYYPFEKISQFLAEFETVVANLEGPVVKEPPEFSDTSLRFVFGSNIAKLLSLQNFDLVSLANNHTLDMGSQGLAKTKEFLATENVSFMGDPLKCTKDFSYQQGNIIYLAFNKTFPSSCPDEEIIKAIKEVKDLEPNHFIIANLHWGEEYQLKSSSFQEMLAHQMIEAGVDLIIGHHPHVVQNIELYKNKLIFYSLGNFIFDQYFSINTEQGLAVGLEFFSDRVLYRLFPIQSELSQPLLMEREAKKAFLKDLAQRSSQELREQIKNGQIEIKK